MDIKGIDEIPMFSWNSKTKEFHVLGHKFDGVNSIEDFINYIINLNEEVTALSKGLTKTRTRRDKYKRKYLKEKWKNKQLNNNWNELKKWLEVKAEFNFDSQTIEETLNDVLNKMQEIESGKNE